MAQKHEILAYMKKGHALTPLGALSKFKCFRLSERIREIEAMGNEIHRDWYTTSSGARVRKYKLIKSA